ncbi:MAG TPA: serine hydrolase domain-containing protein [Planctomycetota bacterium]|nr:serine hydrolase domain-containing protein [Planctomycetota bacterium]
MRARPILVLLCLLLAEASTRTQSAPAPYSDSTVLPHTQAYARARELVELFDKGDAAAFEAYARTAFAGPFLDALPMAEHRAAFLDFWRDNGPLQVHGARSYDPPRPDTAATLVVWSTWLEAWRAIVLEVDGDGKIARLQFSQARRPSDLPKAEALTDAQVAERVAGFVDRLAARDAFSGTVLLAKEGRVLLTKAIGIANRDFDVPVTLDTKFNLGSMNKMMTAVACMQLVEQGKLALDDPVAKYLGEDWLPKVDKSKVEVRHLLTHTSGLGSYFTAEFDRSSRALYRTVDDWKPLVRDETLAFEPGTRWQYSNTGMLIAGAVVEKASGTDYYSYIRAHVTGPAGMTNTDCYETDQANRKLAVGYDKEVGADGAVIWRNNLYLHVVRGGPAGGGYSTVEDLFRFDQALRAQKLVQRGSLDQLWRTYPELSSNGYGLGFFVEQSPVGAIVGHSGGFNGISAVLSMYLDAGYTIAVMCNLGGGAATIVEGKARELIASGR